MTHVDLSRERSIHELEMRDLESAPLWDTVRFDVPGGIDMTVAPVITHAVIDGTEQLPWVHCAGHFADGTRVAALANVFLDPPRIHCPTLYVAGQWHVFFLPPAPAFVLADQGPQALADALGRPVSSVFPITLFTTPLLAATGQPLCTVFTTAGLVPAVA
jgi:pimeloyl-ACP methyl ester carboxylesterase